MDWWSPRQKLGKPLKRVAGAIRVGKREGARAWARSVNRATAPPVTMDGVAQQFHRQRRWRVSDTVGTRHSRAYYQGQCPPPVGALP